MNKNWNELSDKINEFNTLLGSFGEGLTELRSTKAFAKLALEWKKLVDAHNEYDKTQSPIAAVEIHLPFPGQDFAEAWKLYKEYLLETHCVAIRSRTENASLSRLKKMSGENVNRAIEMLEFFISNEYRHIFKPSKRQLTGEETAKVEEKPTFTTSAVNLKKRPSVEL